MRPGHAILIGTWRYTNFPPWADPALTQKVKQGSGLRAWSEGLVPGMMLRRPTCSPPGMMLALCA
eukprot:1659890-Prymnesium_polylepis.1